MQGSLFNEAIKEPENSLPFDGEVLIYGGVIDAKKAKEYFEFLLHHIDWQKDEAIVNGQHFVTNRSYALFGDKEIDYNYSGIHRFSKPWVKEVDEIRQIVQSYTKQAYDSCLLNLYPDGDVGMGWHTDGEDTIKENGSVVALSLGQERVLAFKHRKKKERLNFTLHSGELLEMRGVVQKHWMHSVPKQKNVLRPRISLTFRQSR